MVQYTSSPAGAAGGALSGTYPNPGLSSAGSRPADQALLGWNFDSESASGTALHVSGTIYVHRLYIPTAQPITNLLVGVTTAGGTLTAGQNLAALLDDAGNRLALSVDQSTAWASTGPKQCALTAPYTPTPGYHRIALLSVGTTPVTLASSPGFRAAYEAGTAAATLRHGSNLTGQTSIPTSLAMGSNASTTLSTWVGVS